MEHVVFFPASDGVAGFRRLPSLDEAVRFVEHLRNVEGIDQVSCHALVDVPLAFRTYYRVEVEADPGAAPVAPQVEQQPTLAPVPDLLPSEAPAESPPGLETAGAGANGHRGDGANSLGFFA